MKPNRPPKKPGELPYGHRCPSCGLSRADFYPEIPHPGGVGYIRHAVNFPKEPNPLCEWCLETEALPNDEP